MSNTVIQVENLWKEYRLGTINHHSLTRDLQSWWAKLRGKEDPNSQLGTSTPFLSNPLQNVSEGRFWALQDVSFDVKQGDILGIIGRNGAGKSTLLKILSQVTVPTKGEVRFNGRIASLLEVGTGFHSELTGRENIFLNGAILGMSKEDIRKKLDEIIAFAEVGRFIDTPVKRYSSGMYVRLAFAVAAHLEPEILIVDEVLAVGDGQFQQKCLGKLGEVACNGRTVLFVSHDLQAMKRLCTRGILMSGGQIAHMGTINEAVQTYLASSQQVRINSDILPEMHRIYPPDLEVLRMEIINSSGEQNDMLLMDESFSLRLLYRINVAGCGYRIGIVFTSTDQTKIATVITTGGIRPHLYGEVGKSYSISVRVSNIFKDGRYCLSLHVKNSLEKSIDLIDGFSFTVLPISVANFESFGDGIVRLESEWTSPIPNED